MYLALQAHVLVSHCSISLGTTQVFLMQHSDVLVGVVLESEVYLVPPS